MSVGIALVFVVIFALMGLILAATPWLMKKQECFAVTVPEFAQNDTRLRMFKHRYAAIMLIVTIANCVIVGAIFLLGASSFEGSSASVGFSTASASLSESSTFLVWFLIGGSLLPPLISFGLMLYYRRKVTVLKKKEGWVAQRDEHAAVSGEGDIPKPLSLKWNWLYVAVIASTALIGFAGYPLMPDMIPMHADFSGNVTDYEPKSFGVVGFPVFVQIFMAVCFLVCHVMILRSKQPIDPQRPITSALAYGMFARAQTMYLLVVGVLISAAIGLLFMLSALDWISLGQVAIVIMVLVVAILVPGVIISVVYGQSGARMIRRLSESSEILSDDDSYWKLGIFYWNPQDPSVVLPERFGIGWTFNFARPVSWLVIGSFVVLTIVFIAVIGVLVGV